MARRSKSNIVCRKKSPSRVRRGHALARKFGFKKGSGKSCARGKNMATTAGKRAFGRCMAAKAKGR